MALAETLATHPAMWLLVAAALGLVTGSFLNVVILRLPVMMERAWHRQCSELCGEHQTERAEQEPFDLVRPRSRCPHCGHPIRAWENIPILSYLWLRGRCSACRARISPRYPLVEGITALLSVTVAWQLGFGAQGLAALTLTWGLIALSGIDIDHQILPDSITIPFLWTGLLLSLSGLFTDPQSSILGAVAGYLLLWAVYHLFRWVTGKEGMGYGDFKLLAMLGAWLGWQSLPLVIVLSSVVGAVTGATLILVGRGQCGTPVPFGPYLAAGGWVALLWGEPITTAYLRWSGLGP